MRFVIPVQFDLIERNERNEMSTENRIDEINAEMKKLNATFITDVAATDFEYLQEYHTKMKALTDELQPLLDKDL